MPLRWVDRRTSRPLDRVHGVQCPGGRCVGCFGEGQWGWIPEGPQSSRERRLLDTIEAWRQQIAIDMPKRRSRRVDNWRDALDHLSDVFRAAYDAEAQLQRDRRLQAGCKRAGELIFTAADLDEDDGDEKDEKPMCRIAARAVLSELLRSAPAWA